MSLYPTTDLGLVFDARVFGCDLAIVDGDLALDTTPVTPMLVSLGSDRRAATDDTPPDGVSVLTAPAAWDRRRGWVGDALDAGGRRIGSRLWLIGRDHDGEDTRARAEGYVTQALAWADDEMDLIPEIEVTWLRAGVLRIRAYIDGRSIMLTKKVAA